MANNPHLADFLEKVKGSGAETKSGLLPPIIAPGLFSSITGASEAGNYNSLRQIGEQIQQARANADQAYMMKIQREREKRLKDMLNDLKKQIRAANSAPRYSGGGGGSIPSGIVSSSRGGGTGLNPGAGVRLPNVGGGNDSILPPIVAPPNRSISRFISRPSRFQDRF